MISIWMVELGLGCVGFFALVWRPQPDVGYCEERSVRVCRTQNMQMTLPESMATIVRISLLQLNSGLTMSIFAI